MRTTSSLALGCVLCLVGAAWGQDLDEKSPDARLAEAHSLEEKGQGAKAKEIYESLLPTLRAAGPSSSLGLALTDLGKIAAADGEYEQAAKLSQESADIYRQAGDKTGEAHAMNNKGIARIQNGSYAAAQQDLEQALSLSRAAADVENQVQILNNLGSAYYFQGRYQEASHRYRDALELVDQSPGAGWTPYWRQITNFNEATLYQKLGRNEDALRIFQQVAAGRDLTPSDRAHVMANLGVVYRRLGDPWKALDSYQKALNLYSQSHDSDGELGTLKNIGIVYALELADLPKARQIFQSILVLAGKTKNRREEMQAHLYLGETLLRQHSLADAKREFALAGAQADQLQTTEEQWKAIYGLGRIEQLTGNDSQAEGEYRSAISIIEKSRVQLQLSALRTEFLADKRDVYDALISLVLARNDATETFSLLERSRARNFQDRLSGAHSSSVLTLNEVMSRLPPATVLLESWASGDQVAFVWCTRESNGLLARRFPAGQIDSMRSFIRGIPDNTETDWRRQIAMLAELLPPDPAVFTAGIQHLLIVPDGWLSFVPFDLLPAGNNPSPLLVERFDISYLPSAVLLRRDKQPESRLNFPWISELVAFGDPVVASQPTAAGESGVGGTSLQALPAAAEEIESIAKMAAGKSNLFLRRRDLKREFLGGRANSAFLLHVSTHAFADGDTPEDSRLLFSPDAETPGAEFVFLRELYDLDLSRVHLATISACDTERGRMIRGEGVQAFSRALLSAGCRSALTTLWKVDDRATAEFMQQFYFFALKQRRPTAEALRLAKLKFLHSNTPLENPRYWAAFVLSGDCAAPLPAVISWSQFTLATVALAALLALMLWRLSLRRR